MSTTREVGSSPSLLPMFARAVLPLPRRGGDRLPDTELHLAPQRVDAGRLADYDRVCGFALGDDVPATYLHVLAFPLAVAVMTSGGFPLPLLGLVHVENEITQHRPVGLDEPVAFTVHAADLRAHPAGRQVDLVAGATVDGEPVWAGRSTYLHRTGGGGGGTREYPPAPPGVTVRVPGDIGRRYGAVSGDRNPIHLHPLTARLFGFPSAIAHGMWLQARALATVQNLLPPAYTVRAQFKAPVRLPATVVVASAADGAGRSLSVFARDGRPHLVGGVTPA